MKLRCLIIDDEPLAHDIILEYVKEIPFLEISGQHYLATKALTILNEEAIDLIFLDINMPKLKGLDFLRTLHKKPIVIITSAYEEYALESFELDVCDYLLKPFRFDRFLKAANKALEWHQLQQPQAKAITKEAAPTDANQLFIKADKRLVQVDIADIYYLESYGNYVKVWLQNEFHLTAGSLAGFEPQLPQSDFFRIHKTYIINRKHINYLEGNSVAMRNEVRLPVGKNNRQEFREFLSKKT